MEQMLNFSSEQLNDAYSRMDMRNQAWTKRTSSEVDFIIHHLGLTPPKRILDMGCGVGRHSIDLALRGYEVVGVDLSDILLSQAEGHKGNLNVTFAKRDCRNLSYRGSFDVILCLYDVIGSYRKLDDNKKIIESIHRKLRKGGKAVVSVMNMELTKSIAVNVGNIKSAPSALLKLKSSNRMQTTGNIFNPDFFILDVENHLVYRKEQFERDGQLPVEYVVVDYRFTMDEISSLFKEYGFNILESRFVQAGRWENSLTSLDTKAKEILLLLEKI